MLVGLYMTIQQDVENVHTTGHAQWSNHGYSFFATPPWFFSPKEHQNSSGEMLPPRTGLLNRRNILNRTLFVMYNPKTGPFEKLMSSNRTLFVMYNPKAGPPKIGMGHHRM
jgi:hypothetical protein